MCGKSRVFRDKSKSKNNLNNIYDDANSRNYDYNFVSILYNNIHNIYISCKSYIQYAYTIV